MKPTIPNAIAAVLKASSVPMSANEIYQGIISRSLYQFNSDAPLSIVRSQLRRRCMGLEFPTAEPVKLFSMAENGKYALLPSAVKTKARRGRALTTRTVPDPKKKLDGLEKLKTLHARYADTVKRRILTSLRSLDPTAFEHFGRALLQAYGFENVEVTKRSHDGGIDGHGELKVGLSHLRAAFQCKRWHGAVGRPQIDSFRGAIQGEFELGIFFTTSRFSNEARNAARRPGAAPIALFDGIAILDVMIDKKLGIETEFLPVHSYALDNILT